MSKYIDFILGSPINRSDDRRLSFRYSRARLVAPPTESVIQVTSHPKVTSNESKLSEDGLYVSVSGPLTTKIVKPYQLDSHRKIITSNSPESQSRVLEFSIQELKISDPSLITSISLLYHSTTVCKISPPFANKLCKLLIKRDFNLTLKLTSATSSSILPLPLPNRCVKNHIVTIDFSLPSPLTSGQCLVLVSLKKNFPEPQKSSGSLKFTMDPNDPHNYSKKSSKPAKPPPFCLIDPALQIAAPSAVRSRQKLAVEQIVNVINEPATFSLRDITFNGWFEAARPLRPFKMAAKSEGQIMIEKNEVVALTVLRAVQVPIREENSSVTPVLVVQWGQTIEVTKMADNCNPIWQQTFNLSLPSDFEDEMGIKLILYDQHPRWGLQWLGESVIPMEFNENYYEIERWVKLSRLTCPVERFGYKETGQTRIYICLKVKKNFRKEEKVRVDVLAKTVQRCVVPYRLEGVGEDEDGEGEEEVMKIVMLLRALPVKVGPIMPRQALKIGKVDYYGRAGLMASLLAGVGKEAFVAMGVSQVRQAAAFVVTVGKEVEVWDPENGEKWKVTDTGCSLVRITRMVNHSGIWKNLQTTNILSNLRFNLNITKDWQVISSAASATPREPQTLSLDIEPTEEDETVCEEIESYLKEHLSQMRSRMGFITIFNRHASSVLRPYLLSLSSKDQQKDSSYLEQLYRVYYISGCVINLRYDNKEELLNFFLSTKIQEVTGPVEFSIVCNLQRYIGKICSLWLVVAVLRNRE
ncbi:uncharacterized protein LOC130678275 [Microplitis mediator]|uniref:uncharacterized protein LOC130678275 n=1 Tax=Microplitis mediator TaxID=375433 RepID=UPI0025545C31|nr:uncharacterized protein LOC130678275 [Microplitis mediator]